MDKIEKTLLDIKIFINEILKEEASNNSNNHFMYLIDFAPTLSVIKKLIGYDEKVFDYYKDWDLYPIFQIIDSGIDAETIVKKINSYLLSDDCPKFTKKHEIIAALS